MKYLYVFTLFIAMPFFSIAQTLDELNKPIIDGLDEVTAYHEGLAAIRKGNQWGFMDETGALVIDFRDDLVWNKENDKTNSGIEGIGHPYFKEGLCVITGLTGEGIPTYGFIDVTGKIVIEPAFLNVSQIDNGYAIGIYESKSYRGKNQFQLNIYDYAFTEVVVNKAGEILWPIQERHNIVMSKKLYKLPELRAKMVSDNLLAIKDKNNRWKIVKPKL